VSRSAPVVPARPTVRLPWPDRPRPAARISRAVACGLLALALTACGGVHGTPGGSGVRDPYFPRAGNDGYDVTHYGLDLAYDPEDRHLDGTAEITARAEKDLSAFDLDLKGMDVEKVSVEGATAIVAVSEGMRADLLSAYPDVDPGKVQVIYNGIDAEQYAPDHATDALERHGIDPSAPTIAFVGAFTCSSIRGMLSR